MGGRYPHDPRVRLETIQQHLFSESDRVTSTLHCLLLLVLSWRQGKPPNDGGAEDCVVTGEGGWSEEPCDRLHHWICEKVIDMDHLEADLNKQGP